VQILTRKLSQISRLRETWRKKLFVDYQPNFSRDNYFTLLLLKHLSKQTSVVNSLHCTLPMHSAPRKMIASCKSWRGPNTVGPRDLHSWTGRVPKGVWVYSPVHKPQTSEKLQRVLNAAARAITGTAVLVTSSAMTFTGWMFANVSSSNCAWLCINVCTA